MVELTEATRDEMWAELRRREADRVRDNIVEQFEVRGAYCVGKFATYEEAYEVGLEHLAGSSASDGSFSIQKVYSVKPAEVVTDGLG